MAKKMLIDATHAEETRVVVVEGNKVEEFDFESLNKRQLAGNIYLAKVTRVEPSLQAAFVDYGGNRHGFLAFSEIHPDYYQIPVADREALLAEEAALEQAAGDEEDEKPKSRGRGRSRSRSRSKSSAASEGAATTEDAVIVEEAADSGSTLVEDLPETAAPETAGTGTPEDARGETADEAKDSAAAPDTAEDTTDPAEPEPDATAEADASADDDDQTDDPAEGKTDKPDSRDDYDTVGANEAREEIAPRRTRQRRYKIQEVIKVRQILLVQVVKEERGNKGAALTTYLSLAGRYCVLMPNTARGGGISRKITNATDRKKLKAIAGEIEVPKGAGLIVRTAGAKRTKTEIKRDYEYLLRQWEQIRDLTLKSIAPAHIYEEGSLIKRSIRDLYSRDIDEVFVEGERGYREAKDYMKMLMPSHARNVKQYAEALPLFSRYQVENYLAAMFNPTVQLRSGGYIVIDVTEALVAVDVNSGRATKESSIEETALKTNLEAAEEVARQARLRDLAGLIVIDFIDMDERKNNAAVEKRLKDRLKSDRARIQIGRISGFGLLEMSRQRLRPGMLEATTAPCAHCHGTGRVRSNDSMALAIMRDLEEEGVRQRSKEVLVTAPVDIANYILNVKREHVAMIETRFGLSVRVEGDASVISPDFKLERFNTATRQIPEATAIDAIQALPEPVAENAAEVEAVDALAEDDGDAPKKKRRRRRRRGGKGRDDQAGEVADTADAASDDTATPTEPQESGEADQPKAKSRSRSRSRSRTKKADAQPDAEAPAEAQADPGTDDAADSQTQTPDAAVPAAAEAEAAGEGDTAAETAAPTGTNGKRPRARARASAEQTIAGVEAASDDGETALAESPEEAKADTPRRRGWWSRATGRG
ncbi:MAG: ribonuclease E/G [Pseudomonadota bacterium]